MSPISRAPQGPQGEQGEQGDGQEQQPQDESDLDTQGIDPQQLLQGVRDREAQRREEREARTPSGYETVEKDW